MRFSMGRSWDQRLLPIEEIRTEDEVALEEKCTARKKSEILRKKRDFAKIRFDCACNRSRTAGSSVDDNWWMRITGSALSHPCIDGQTIKAAFLNSDTFTDVRRAAQKFPDSSRCCVTARYVSGASKRKRRNASKRWRAKN